MTITVGVVYVEIEGKCELVGRGTERTYVGAAAKTCENAPQKKTRKFRDFFTVFLHFFGSYLGHFHVIFTRFFLTAYALFTASTYHVWLAVANQHHSNNKCTEYGTHSR